MRHEIITEQVKATKAIQNLDEWETKMIDFFESERDTFKAEINKKIRQLEDEKSEIENSYGEKMDKVREATKLGTGELLPKVKKYERVMSLLEIWKQKKIDIELKPKPTGRWGVDEKVETLDVLYRDEYINVCAFIYRNDKPKNCYTLALCGKSIFGSKILEFGRCYGLRLNFKNTYEDFSAYMKDAPSKEELRTYYNKQNKLELWEKNTYLELKKEYEWVKQNCNTREWEIEYWKSQRDYYKHQVSRGEDTREYRAAIKKLKELGVIKSNNIP